jgi:hypothetical protein
MLPEAMRAVRFHAHGAPDTLVVEEVARPVPRAGEVLVRVHAAGVNPLDWKIRQGWWKDSLPPTLPAIPGVDLAGVVAAVGPEVTTSMAPTCCPCPYRGAARCTRGTLPRTRRLQEPALRCSKHGSTSNTCCPPRSWPVPTGVVYFRIPEHRLPWGAS